MDEFLDIHNPQNLNQDEINNLKWFITHTELENVIKNLLTPTKKIPGPDGFSRVLPNLQRRISAGIPQIVLQNKNWKNMSKFFLWSH